MSTSGPSPAGVAQLRQAAAELASRPAPPSRRHRWPRWLTWKRLALILVADLVVGHYAWHYLTRPDPGAQAAAVVAVGRAAAHNDWQAVYDRLCTSDRRQVTVAELETAGRAALLSLGAGLDHVTVTSVRPVSVSVSGLPWPAATVSGRLVPVVGTPSGFTVTVVREPGGWKPCLSAGGYSSDAMHVDVPLGSGQLGFGG